MILLDEEKEAGALPDARGERRGERGEEEGEYLPQSPRKKEMFSTRHIERELSINGGGGGGRKRRAQFIRESEP